MHQIELKWMPLNITVTATLEYDKNPRLATLLWEKLPYASLQNHALVSGNHLYNLAPFPELIYTTSEFKEDRTLSADGTLFLSQLQHLAIKYGPLSEYIPAAPVGRVIPEHLPLLREAGRACWEAAHTTKQPIIAYVSRKDGPSSDGTVQWAPLAGSPEVQKLTADIRAATQRIWIDPPKDIVDLHEGRIASGAGSYGQYLSTLVFVNGETRPLGYDALNGLVRLSRAHDMTLGTLKSITANFIRTPAEFLGYCGLDELWTFTQQVIAALDRLETKDEYFSLLNALALYANCLNTWNLHYFPWKLGDAYPHRQAAGQRR
ncbi:hypothetical protein [Burkholderia ubonensis]|uniref:Cucumopine synthase C-terminal helical bundle domain-containing protein n=1 Tax=Burkholderia ubonensis TaxID=101571 RepID=A0AAW3N152_9BURK|nr:hypothetical protein [Burkholderia ubonensis]KVL09689.1 hypothetical protein WJ45_03940 [Burkholderia ubonensis]KVQ02825.1 hypothetical protein WJ96_29965 [Burkholderia ubonensis]KVQ59692.1 hypothetical protein WK04_27035 [Burkholderia ubonensis]KVX18093.1 hypothetical protein WL02_13475 [Burkholderia ubonensis]KVZ93514.1 hypothetical protein WL22_20375 [Burkholderia ubonensis]